MNFKKTLSLLLVSFLVSSVSLCFAESATVCTTNYTTPSNCTSSSDNKTLARAPISNKSNLRGEALLYRQKGFEAQSSGDLDTAMKFYQKALEFEPYYPGVYNDLGVIFETKGWTDRAEQVYLKAIEIDPKYINPYSNLALLYTKKGDLRKAASYWKKRAEMGNPADPWTVKAQEEYRRIANIYPDMKNAIMEQEAIELVDSVSRQKQIQAAHPEMTAKDNLRRAKNYYKQQDYAAAFRELINAQALDPRNKEIQKLIEIIQKKILS